MLALVHPLSPRSHRRYAHLKRLPLVPTQTYVSPSSVHSHESGLDASGGSPTLENTRVPPLPPLRFHIL